VPFIDQSAVLSALIDHPRIHGAACSLLGDDFNYTGSDGNFYVGDTGWHRDGAHTQTRYIKIAYYLDSLTGDTGALRVIPGSHRFSETYGREAQDAAGNPASVGVTGAEIPAIALDVTPGDVLIFNHNTLHSSWKGGSRRRMFTMNLCQRYPEDRLHELQHYLTGHSRFHIERNIGPQMLAGAGPQRMRHLQQVMENDFLLAKLSAERKARGEEPARG
jgi:ectoine hydroxylase-related dioxygenase (phytanoyl-CoA dioxygenase family)